MHSMRHLEEEVDTGAAAAVVGGGPILGGCDARRRQHRVHERRPCAWVPRSAGLRVWRPGCPNGLEGMAAVLPNGIYHICIAA